MEEEITTVFEYTWKLENHNILNPFQHASVQSPEFNIPTTPQIKWVLGYSPKCVYDSLDVFLKRSDNDDGPLMDDVMYNISILNENDTLGGISEISKFSFQKGHAKICIIDLKEEISLNVSNILTLKCRFFETDIQIGIELQEDPMILSNDIKSLFTNEVLWDITLKQSDCEFKAHKAILWARCPELLTLQTPKNHRDNLHGLKILPDELKSLLNDVYSGQLNTFKSDMPLFTGVRKCELILQGKTLSSLCVHSNVERHSISQVWSLNFNHLSCKKKKYTPVLAIKENEFKLVAQVTNHSGREKVEFSLRCISTKTRNPVYLHYKIKLLRTKEEFYTSSSHLFYSAEEYILPWDLSDILRDNRCLPESQGIFGYCFPFDLECTLSVSDGSLLCISETWHSKPSSTEIDYKILRENLLNLYKSEKFSDMSLVLASKTFCVHKAILAARSPVFLKMFQSNMAECLSNRVTITDIEAEIMQSLLEYIYTGHTKVESIEYVMQLYTVADKYEVLNMKETCSSYLESNINFENVEDILFLADMHQDDKLKTKAQTFMYECGDKSYLLMNEEY